MKYQEYNSEQSKVYTNAVQLFEALKEHRSKGAGLHASMHWKVIKGHEYLYKAWSYGKNRSLGRRTADTERIKELFEQQKAAYTETESTLIAQLALHAQYVKANRLNRFPRTAARVMRALEKEGLPFRLIGTNALYAYEASAGVLLLPEFLATDDVDFLLDSRQGVKIAAKLKKRTLLGLLRQTDKTFSRLSSSPFEFAAVNDAGYRVEFITQGNQTPYKDAEFLNLLEKGDLIPMEISSLKWLVSAPQFDAVVFDEHGMPLSVKTVDPRAYALHKYYASKQPDRNPTKKQRDILHAQLISELIHKRLHHLPLPEVIQQIFPTQLTQEAKEHLDPFMV